MMDQRIETLAKNLINFSCSIKRGESVLIESIGDNDALTRALIKEAYRVGANPFVWLRNKRIDRELTMNCNEGQLELRAKIDAEMMSNMQAYIGIRGGDNASELSDVPQKNVDMDMLLYWTPVHSRIRVPKTKWVILRYPTPSMAQMANMSTDAFEEYYFNVCNLDYSKMDKAMDPLKALMERTDQVHIKGPGTDLRFSIKGLPAIKCAGHMNIPDGEIYTAPVKNSVNGTLQYNTPSLHNGFTYTDIRLTFKDGKIVDSHSNDDERICSAFNVDEGARYVGEFALGVNPYITKPMKDTLFDEKIAGSFHFTPGCCYDECNNHNKSSLHWDLVCIQTPEYGGGEIYFDGTLVRKDGRFVLKELEPLNPENLI